MTPNALRAAIGTFLRVGVLVCAAVIAGGMALGLVEGDGATRGRAIVNLGLFLLILLPVARVALTLCLFVAEKDRRFAVVSAVVLTILALGFALGAAA